MKMENQEYENKKNTKGRSGIRSKRERIPGKRREKRELDVRL